MKFIAFDETEKFIMKGVIENVKPENREQAIFEYLEMNMNNPALEQSQEGNLLISVLSGLYGKLIEYDSLEIIDVLQSDLSSIFDENKMYIPYDREEVMEEFESFEKEYPLTDGSTPNT